MGLSPITEGASGWNPYLGKVRGSSSGCPSCHRGVPRRPHKMLPLAHPGTLDWFLHSTAALWMRIGIGAFIFACLAAVDVHRNGRQATRWREYLFLLAS